MDKLCNNPYVVAQTKILIVDDDIELGRMLREYLEPEGFAVSLAQDSDSCFACGPERHDLVVLDVMLPGMSGFEILKVLRRSSSVPVVMLTARDGESDRVVGLEIGGDDYIAKPVKPRELIARIRAILRRSASHHGEVREELVVGNMRLHGSSRSVWSDGRELELTTAEFNLLEYLLHHVGQIVSRDDLSIAAFGRSSSFRVDRNVDTLVSKIRRKLEPRDSTDYRIKTIRNVGYIYAASTVRSDGG